MAHTLFVGLGNPGSEYAKNRHNIGFMAIDRFGDRFSLSASTKKFSAHYDSGFALNEKVTLIKPQTYMNLSGKSVVAASQFFEIEPELWIVVHDEIDLPLGSVKVKIGGGHGGHNGLRDIIAKSGTKEFVRVRMGVGRPKHGAVADYVLGNFRQDEVDVVDEMLETAADVFETIIQDGAESAQNKFNGG